ncbi:MAG: threonine-phosphate decarboxylase CobD [Eubacteriales bacterium]|nr:threonine-phosphate decarboxylase CobD [Eubacteriales bacterium]
MERIHGGDWAAYREAYGTAPLDFSASVSPLGVPDGVQAAIRRAAAEADRYPDPFCRRLRRAIAAHEGVPEAWVLCGSGAADLIWRAVLAAKPGCALVTAPCFGEYEAALESCGCELLRFPLREPFALTEDILWQIDRGLDLLFLCSPNNPTGRTVEPGLLRRIVRRCGESGTRLILDECFADFLDEPELYTAKGLLESALGLLILKAFTKLYGMAGVRLGYALCADTAYLEAMRRAGPPWSVSTLAQEAGLAALEDQYYVNRLRALIRSERPLLAHELEALGLKVIPGEANFLLFQGGTELAARLRERGILIRSCDDFHGLDASWYRVAVRTREDNDRLIAALREMLT